MEALCWTLLYNDGDDDDDDEDEDGYVRSTVNQGPGDCDGSFMTHFTWFIVGGGTAHNNKQLIEW